MNVETFMATMQAYRNRKPYKPFTMVLLNGERFEVDYPVAVNVRDGVGVFLAAGGIPHVFDHEGVLQVIGELSDKQADAG